MELQHARIVFMGTPEYSVPSLLMLLENGYDVVCVITQEDKKQGRGNKLLPPPIKIEAQNRNIPVIQPKTLKTEQFQQELMSFFPELYITIAYGKIIPQKILDLPKYGCINVHASLLPKYRGPAPIWWAVINGEEKSGVTTMYSDAGIDTGDILLQREVALERDITTGKLHDKLSVLSAQVLKETLILLSKDKIVRTKQDEASSSYAPLITKELGHINWDMDADKIRNLIRGLNPYPCAYSIYKNEKMKIFDAEVSKKTYDQKKGTIIEVSKEGILVCCLKNSLRITKIQMPNKKPLLISDYLNGNKLESGEVLG